MGTDNFFLSKQGVHNSLLFEAVWIKRATDLVVSLVVSPVICLAVLAISISFLFFDKNGAIFYGHKRVGKKGRTITVWKFRTMVENSDEVLDKYLEANPAMAAEWEATRKLKHDPRITPLGRFLRKTSLDELPQFYNVLRGDISLVGPRPITKEEAPKYSEVYPLYISVRPGLTGLWQVSGRNNLSYSARVKLDKHYIQTWSFWLDLRILLITPWVVLTQKGAS